jgi:hypothetical protein
VGAGSISANTAENTLTFTVDGFDPTAGTLDFGSSIDQGAITAMVNAVKAHPDNIDGDGNIVLPFSGSADLYGGDIAAFYNGIFDAITSGTIVLDLSACTTTIFHSPGNTDDFSVPRRGRIAKITLPPGLTQMLGGVFSQFSHLKEVVFTGTGLTGIPNMAFNGCGDLTSITLPANLETIGSGTFYSCGLTSIVIPASVTSIGDSAFSYSALTDVTFLSAAPPTLGTGSFSGTAITAVHVLSGSLGDYTTPTAGYATAGQQGLPAAVKWIGDAAP